MILKLLLLSNAQLIAVIVIYYLPLIIILAQAIQILGMNHTEQIPAYTELFSRLLSCRCK